MTPTLEVPPTGSPVTARAVAFVADHKPAAEALGTSLADSINDPDGFAAALRNGLDGLADPEYHEGQQTVAPGLGATLGIRWPLQGEPVLAERDRRGVPLGSAETFA